LPLPVAPSKAVAVARMESAEMVVPPKVKPKFASEACEIT